MLSSIVNFRRLFYTPLLSTFYISFVIIAFSFIIIPFPPFFKTRLTLFFLVYYLGLARFLVYDLAIIDK